MYRCLAINSYFLKMNSADWKNKVVFQNTSVSSKLPSKYFCKYIKEVFSLFLFWNTLLEGTGTASLSSLSPSGSHQAEWVPAPRAPWWRNSSGCLMSCLPLWCITVQTFPLSGVCCLCYWKTNSDWNTSPLHTFWQFLLQAKTGLQPSEVIVQLPLTWKMH